ncbi:MAG: LON peptidase substrate-binding domain-containing protein [Gammaproteobacteria bacterium]|nr:LON peptidase substrate-binding domain-containing protein [Gammaproteobacteria bacterium]MBV9726211.1 LON peptidase substrate-binding domain-containing protein [Gammaproteobacteria bacterium]
MSVTSELPLFPLNTVLFPGGPLRLRIFEPRYLDMVRRCLKTSGCFGVVLILEGEEAGAAVNVAGSGTSARVVDFDTLPDGLLGIDCLGEQCFRVLRRWQQEDGLNLAEVESLPDDPPCALPAEFAHLGELLRELLPQLGERYAHVVARYEDAGWVANRWAEVLPLNAAEQQQLLELADPLARLAQVAAWSTRQPPTEHV